jgi:hypothetical protein
VGRGTFTFRTRSTTAIALVATSKVDVGTTEKGNKIAIVNLPIVATSRLRTPFTIHPPWWPTTKNLLFILYLNETTILL